MSEVTVSDNILQRVQQLHRDESRYKETSSLLFDEENAGGSSSNSNSERSRKNTLNIKQRPLSQRMFTKDALEAIFCFIALTGSLVIYGILQERIMTVPFGPSKSVFKHSIFLVFCNRVIACLLSFSYIILFGNQLKLVAPLSSYGFVSIANVISSTCQYEALKYVVFSVQVLAKCSKIIPVMIWQTLISRKKYNYREYFEAVLIATGCALFLLTGEVETKAGSRAKSSVEEAYLYGAVLLLVYLAVDGFTSTWQGKLFTGYDMDISNQVLYTTLCSVVLSFGALLGEGKFIVAIEFMKSNPEAWAWIFGISVASASVQFFVTYTIKKYGALVFATIMTTRQWFSILISCLVFAHPMSYGQWFGTAIVFGTLYNAFYQKQKGSLK